MVHIVAVPSRKTLCHFLSLAFLSVFSLRPMSYDMYVSFCICNISLFLASLAVFQICLSSSVTTLRCDA